MGNMLVICDSEKVYGRRLYEYLLKRQSGYDEIKLFSSVELMRNNLSGSRIDTLMIDEAGYAEYIKAPDERLKVDRIKILTSKKPEPGVIAESSIYKYQSARDILNTIVSGSTGGAVTLSDDNKKKETKLKRQDSLCTLSLR